MGRALSLVYGGIVYLYFLAVFLYAVGFVGGFGVPRTIDAGARAGPGEALLIDLGLLLLFAVQHSVMARDWFKERWTKIVPRPLERSTYVLVASVILTLTFWQWRPMPDTVWSVEGVGASVLWAVFAAGWAIVLASTFLIDHLSMFGLRQVWANVRGVPFEHPGFGEPGLYRYVRHPLYFGFLLAFWATPEMSVGHLLFAAATTGYILVAIQFEERDLLRYHGSRYADYRDRVSMILPRAPRATGEEDGGGG